MHTGGICGSDLHYYQHGGFGTVRIKSPLVLGHEIAGTVAAVVPALGHKWVIPNDRSSSCERNSLGRRSARIRC